MSIISSFLKLPSWEKKIALETLFWVIRIRIMIWLFPFSTVQNRVQNIARNHNSTTKNKISMSRLRIMVMAASKYVPHATCLVQALAGYILFSKYGYTTSIKIGVLNENGEFEAHAWLEHDEKVVLGESEKNFRTILGID
ncbi:lasso peptide biosynthesis B2 protein [Methanobacterium formicicum]|uniref:Lasso peptide biosynthesis B2 protein n=1 Tax=Methanobacterium formicicum TaxID=2162 RepID=A0A843AN56_METFO|nr:lasso peptide biosynthesis B2 protein [Methanobacterium formicicum]MBF4475236.1 lasso peptide biosynthesis B2 protein [Methanobacterium formicicum]